MLSFLIGFCKKMFSFRKKKLVGSVFSSEFWSATLSWADLGVGWGDRCRAFVCQIFIMFEDFKSKINIIYIAGKRLHRFLSGSAPVPLSFKNSNLTVKWSLFYVSQYHINLMSSCRKLTELFLFICFILRMSLLYLSNRATTSRRAYRLR